jgi:hypothetical protein
MRRHVTRVLLILGALATLACFALVLAAGHRWGQV